MDCFLQRTLPGLRAWVLVLWGDWTHSSDHSSNVIRNSSQLWLWFRSAVQRAADPKVRCPKGRWSESPLALNPNLITYDCSENRLSEQQTDGMNLNFLSYNRYVFCIHHWLGEGGSLLAHYSKWSLLQLVNALEGYCLKSDIGLIKQNLQHEAQ